MRTATAPIVFLGPSMSVEAAQEILDADYRPPVRRGDLAGLAGGSVVALIDGVFDQELAVSLGEVQNAVERGVVVFGGASMGALRAAEVPAVVGVGRVYEWYRDGVIRRDEEVALLFDDSTGRALTVPTVNVRFAVGRLVQLGTIDQPTADAILGAAIAIPYRDRTYRAVLERSGIAGRADTADLISMLGAFDLKQLDAQAVLEAVAGYRPGAGVSEPSPGASEAEAAGAACRSASKDAILIWESGDYADFGDLVAFLAFTGRLEPAVRRVVAADPARTFPPTDDGFVADGSAQTRFVEAVRRWGWMSAEEADVTLRDLGLRLPDLNRYTRAVVAWNAGAVRTARGLSPELLSALRADLFLDDMALKREVMRLGALHGFAARAGQPDADDVHEARAVLCKVNRAETAVALQRHWQEAGLTPEAQQAFIDVLARARKFARRLAACMNGQGRAARQVADRAGVMPMVSQPKPPGEPRFSRGLSGTLDDVHRLAGVIGVTRIGLIGELASLRGVEISQVARPGSAWSSSYGSGKARTADGAIVGGVMEELEKWAQEQFRADGDSIVCGSFTELGTDERFVSPETLDLPYDSGYRPERALRWYPCADLLRNTEAYLPLDVLTMRRLPHDICFSPRGARKHMATNGLGSAFTLEEAVLHGICEYIERHALRLAELFLVNPGGLGTVPYRFVDISGASDRLRELAACVGEGGVVKVLDITSDVAVPTFLSVVIKDGRRADGSAAHPDPETAIEMSLLEAAQTIASAVAGAREDLSIKARSLGRHERPRPVTVDDLWFWLDPDGPTVPVTKLHGLSSTDVQHDVAWVLDRLHDAGLNHCCVLDLSRDEVTPARVVRAIVPGLETNNPFFTGERARLVLLRDLVPKWR